MSKTEKPILKVLANETPDHVPLWLMRQAGRYLPEYRELRSKAENFLNLCLTPEWATEITLQPIRRFGFDAAILFADILLVPMALGTSLMFREGEGPVLERIESESDLKKLCFDNKKVLPVYETVSRVKAALDHKTTLIGFCGAPWTVGCYMLDSNSKGGFVHSKRLAAEKQGLLSKLVEILIEASAEYLGHQVEAGAEVLQIFDSWAGLLQGEDFNRWVIEPTKILVQRIKSRYPHIPVIGFPREARPEDYKNYIEQTGVDAVSIDYDISLDYAKQHLQPVKPLQGNLDPALLVQGGEAMKKAAINILEKMGPKHIFNLGHGVVPQTPPAHVAELVKLVHDFKI